MLSTEMQQPLNEQIWCQFSRVYACEAVAIFASVKLTGLARWVDSAGPNDKSGDAGAQVGR